MESTLWIVDSPHFDSIWEAGIVSNWLQILCFKLCLVCLCFPPVVWGRCAIVANGFGVWKLMSEEDGGGGEGGEEEQEVGGRDPHVQCRHCKYLNIKMWKKSRFKVSFVSIFLLIFFQILFRSFWHQRIYDTALGSRDIAMWRFLWRTCTRRGIGYSRSWMGGNETGDHGCGSFAGGTNSQLRGDGAQTTPRLPQAPTKWTWSCATCCAREIPRDSRGCPIL